jgi:hypothetical protein
MNPPMIKKKHPYRRVSKATLRGEIMPLGDCKIQDLSISSPFSNGWLLKGIWL